MKCKICGNKTPISKPLLISVIIEGIIILFLLFVIFLLGLLDITQNQSVLPEEKSVAEELTDSVNLTPYYSNCSWCPNYGYITGARPTHWQLNTDNPIYEYPLDQEQLNKYINNWEENLFEKNPFSTGNMYLYSRKGANGKKQSIVLSPDLKNNTICVYMTEE